MSFLGGVGRCVGGRRGDNVRYLGTTIHVTPQLEAWITPTSQLSYITSQDIFLLPEWNICIHNGILKFDAEHNDSSRAKHIILITLNPSKIDFLNYPFSSFTRYHITIC